MKKIIKNNLFGFILGILVCSGIVYAASYYAKDVTYNPTDASWEVSNVNDALDDLYTNIKDKEMELLWENTTNDGFVSGGTIELDLSNYRYIVLELMNSTNNIILMRVNEDDTSLPYPNDTYIGGGSNPQIYSRRYTVNENGVVVYVGWFYHGEASTWYSGRNYIAPKKIYGVK